jgi:hypothetical protein
MKQRPQDHELYRLMSNMKTRCYNPNNEAYHRYGGRGIKICDRWLASFWNFVADMGPRPEGATIDRIDNDGDYTPENCRWATRKENANNTSTNRFITHNGETKTLAEWAELCGISQGTLKHRLDVAGYTMEQALSTPLRDHLGRSEDMINHRGAKPITFNGETHTQGVWADKFGVARQTMSKHVRKYGEQGAIQLHFIKSGAR